MKRITLSVLMMLVCLGVHAGNPSAETSNTDQMRVLPVLVSVNAKGKVTSVVPPINLRAKEMRALKQAVDAMITRPATKDGHGISSRFILQLSVKNAPGGTGGTTFSYLAAQPAPSGPVHWVNRKGAGLRQFALVRTQVQQSPMLAPARIVPVPTPQPAPTNPSGN